MPELPEVEVTRLGFANLIAGARIEAVRMGKPLRQVEDAAKRVGSGETPMPLDESGPQEIAVVAHAFNQMTSALARTDADRALILAGVSHDLRTPLARLRLEAVHLHTRVPLDALLAHNQGPVGETAGDAAGDIFGADLGL